MNKAWEQNTDEMQEEELYALLDRAMETERLCVSEELIQKTLQRVAEEEDTKVISFEKAKKKKVWPVAYAGVAAAVLVLVLGVRTFNSGNFTAEDAQMKDLTLSASETKKADSLVPFGLTADATNGDAADGEPEVEYSVSDSHSDFVYGIPEESVTVPEAESRGGKNVMSSVTLTVSEDLTGILSDAGMAVMTGEAEYWEFVTPEKDWERELLYALMAGAVVEEELPKGGSYSYGLSGKDGSRWQIQSNEPVDAVVRLDTEQGVLWGLLGEGASFYIEAE